MSLLGSKDEVGNLGGVLDKNFDVYCGIDAFNEKTAHQRSRRGYKICDIKNGDKPDGD